MNKENFLNDLQKIYDFLNEQKANTNDLIKYLENKEYDKLTIIDEFAKDNNLSIVPLTLSAK